MRMFTVSAKADEILEKGVGRVIQESWYMKVREYMGVDLLEMFLRLSQFDLELALKLDSQFRAGEVGADGYRTRLSEGIAFYGDKMGLIRDEV